MRVSISLACMMAALALVGCNKNKDQGTGTATGNDNVKITQAAPPPGGTWADVVNATNAGFMMGNPNAKVKLVEIGALSCPHCMAFEEEGVPTLTEKYVKTGQVSWEFRPYVIHGAVDLAANLIVRCNGLKTFFPMVKAIYKDQPVWLGKIQAVPPEKVEQIQSLPPNQVFVAMANLIGLQDWAAARGLPPAKSNQCLSDEKMIDREVQLTSDVSTQYPEFQGTPAFILNGKMLDKVASWETLEPQLKAAVG